MNALVLQNWAVVPPGSEQPIAHLSLSLDAGDVGVLLGASGSGKTTTLRQIAGLGQRALGQSMMVWGSAGPLPWGQVFFLPDRPGLALDWSGRDCILEMAALSGIPRKQADANAQQWAERLGVRGLLGKRTSRYSRGEAARLSLLRLLIQPRGLLLLDEPTAHLDPEARRQLRLAVGDWAREAPQRSVLIASHHLDDAAHDGVKSWQLERTA